MIKKTITYKDFNDIERTEDFYFHLMESEILEMEMGVKGGLTEMIKKIIAAQDSPRLIELFKDLVFKAYGEKSADGRQFMKSPELSKAFSETPAYSIIFMELATDDKKASEFVNGIIPADLAKKVAESGHTHPALK